MYKKFHSEFPKEIPRYYEIERQHFIKKIFSEDENLFILHFKLKRFCASTVKWILSRSEKKWGKEHSFRLRSRISSKAIVKWCKMKKKTEAVSNRKWNPMKMNATKFIAFICAEMSFPPHFNHNLELIYVCDSLDSIYFCSKNAVRFQKCSFLLVIPSFVPLFATFSFRSFIKRSFLGRNDTSLLRIKIMSDLKAYFYDELPFFLFSP